jgi:hypothetical protein
MERKIDVVEVTFCNSVSVAEHVVMMILGLVRNYIPSYQQVVNGGWNIADCVERAYDLEQMHVGTVAAGRIGLAVLRRLKPFDVHLHYTDRHRLPAEVESELNLTYHHSVESMVKKCDVVTINCPLHPETEHLFNESLLAKMKRGSYIVNTARGKICDRNAIAKALETGQLAGYAGDVWFPQPAPPVRCVCGGLVVCGACTTLACLQLCSVSYVLRFVRHLFVECFFSCFCLCAGSPLAHDAVPRHDAAHLRHDTVCSGPLCRRRPRDFGVLLCQEAHPERVLDCEGRQAGWHGQAFLLRGQCHRWLP